MVEPGYTGIRIDDLDAAGQCRADLPRVRSSGRDHAPGAAANPPAASSPTAVFLRLVEA